jgi:hypothetical protein
MSPRQSAISGNNVVRLGVSNPTVSHEPIAEPPAADQSGDPIFAAIATHRAACVAYQQGLWKEIHMKGGYTAKYEAVEDASNAALDREGDVLEALLNCRPTTLAGVVAVLDHLSLPEFLIEGREGRAIAEFW